MNASIKRRQTLLINWLAKKLNCKPINVAQTGSYYTEFSTSYAGKSVIRISDHMSNDRTYIHVIMNPINTIVTVTYKNFMLSGTFEQAKQTLYTLIMSKAMNEAANPIPTDVTPVKQIKTSPTYAITRAEYKALNDTQKQYLKKLINKSGSWNDIKAHITKEAYIKAKEYARLNTLNATTSISKSAVLRLSSVMQKEVLGWINAGRKTYSTIEEIPVETIPVTPKQFKTLTPYLS